MPQNVETNLTRVVLVVAVHTFFATSPDNLGVELLSFVSATARFPAADKRSAEEDPV